MSDPQTPCVCQFKVALRGISPMIWRRLLLRSDRTIADLHYAIQIAMGWTDAHLNRFHIHGKDYGVAHEGGLTFSDDPDGVSLAQFGFRLRERFLYEYDFYDGWQHDVRLEKVLPLNSKRLLPVCTGGQRLAPPEDCGRGAGLYGSRGPALAGLLGCPAAGRVETDGRGRPTFPQFGRRPLRHRRSRDSACRP